jgi:alanine dehydrogenase
VRPGISRVLVYDTNEASMDSFVQDSKGKHGLDVEKASSVKDAVREADIVTTTTPVRSPIVMAEDISEGTHINAIGADAKGKEELDPEILKKARVVIDNWKQASHSGEINVPLSKGVITREHIHGDIGEIVSGKKPGRESPEQITVFDSTGLAIQDISAATEIFRKLTSDDDIEAKLEKIDFL